MYRCTGCGSTQTIDEIRRFHPQAISCCPERKMEPVLVTDDMVLRAILAVSKDTTARISDTTMQAALEAALSD